MDAAWFEGCGEEGELHRAWFLHIGGGRNICHAGVPVRLTRKAAHHFLQAPDAFSIAQALRWGQTLGFGGDGELAWAIAATRLKEILPDEPFWASVIRFLVGGQADQDSIGGVVDYVLHRRLGEPGDPQSGKAPEPGFTMKGRTLPALLRAADEWRARMPRDPKPPRFAWRPSGIPALTVDERSPYGTLETWSVGELTDSRALQEEGRDMRHCVATYVKACLSRKTSIWSLTVKPAGDPQTRRVLTLEVDNRRRSIVQVRGRCNRLPRPSEAKGRLRTAQEMLRRWAQQAGLTLPRGS